MGDELDLDGCECFWSHELSIRRLLNLIRQSQDYCTDTECIDLPSLDNPGGRESTSAGDDGVGGFTTLTMMLVFAVILFLMRPNRNRQSIKSAAVQDANTPGNHHDDDHDDDMDRPGTSGGGGGGGGSGVSPSAVN